MPSFLATTRAVMNSRGQTIAAHEYLLELAALPVLVVWGTHDMVIPVDHAKRLSELAPACQIEIFDGAGHFPHLDQPDRFADVLRAFMAVTDRGDEPPTGSVPTGVSTGHRAPRRARTRSPRRGGLSSKREDRPA